MRHEAPWDASYNRRMPLNEYGRGVTTQDAEIDDLMKELEKMERN